MLKSFALYSNNVLTSGRKLLDNKEKYEKLTICYRVLLYRIMHLWLLSIHPNVIHFWAFPSMISKFRWRFLLLTKTKPESSERKSRHVLCMIHYNLMRRWKNHVRVTFNQNETCSMLDSNLIVFNTQENASESCTT